MAGRAADGAVCNERGEGERREAAHLDNGHLGPGVAFLRLPALRPRALREQQPVVGLGPKEGEVREPPRGEQRKRGGTTCACVGCRGRHAVGVRHGAEGTGWGKDWETEGKRRAPGTA